MLEDIRIAIKLSSLSQIAAKVAAPLTKVDEIVVLSGDNSKVTSEVNRLLAELPASVHALTGVDLSKVCAQKLWETFQGSPADS